MTQRRLKNTLLRLSYMLLLIPAVAGCIRDDLTGCEDIYTLTVKAYNAAGEELSAEDVKDVTLFIFDGEACYLRKVETAVGQSIRIKAPAGENLNIVAWGNLSQGSQTCAEPLPGDHLDGCFVGLMPDTRAAAYCLSPGDLFRGSVTLTPQSRNAETVLPVYREAGSMAITIRNLKTFAGYVDDDYSVVVRETPSAIGFDGALSGEKAAYRPTGAFAANGDFVVAPFNLLPESGLYIDIYHGTQLITTVSKDNADNPLAVEKGRLTNVLIDLKASVNISVQLTDWGQLTVWKDF